MSVGVEFTQDKAIWCGFGVEVECDSGRLPVGVAGGGKVDQTLRVRIGRIGSVEAIGGCG